MPDTRYAWTVIGVFDDQEPPKPGFLYTVGLFEQYGLPELWVNQEATCGHRCSMQGLCAILNKIGDKLVSNEIVPGDSHEESFAPHGATLHFDIAMPEESVDPEKYQTFQANEAAPVCPVTWHCCDGKAVYPKDE